MNSDVEQYFPRGTKVQVVPIYSAWSRTVRAALGIKKPETPKYWQARTVGDGHPLKSAKREVTVRAWCLAVGWEIVP